MKVARTVLSGGKDGDNFKVLPIATNFKQKNSQQKLTARFSKGEQGESNLIGCLQY
ncbi:hypothetical protein [Bacillus cereus]|uniref:Uncharacterized protein n=1 Tax=Bacillus cereus HuA3-9 TaxID=1053205 RepID=R8DD20_BACCE|nr:hypothetical protein [Bacillus cereus]EOO21637.1 hypothetical protein IGA_01308 [Bacillus cereus HuA3-9]